MKNAMKAKSEMKFGMEVTDEKWYGNRNWFVLRSRCSLVWSWLELKWHSLLKSWFAPGSRRFLKNLFAFNSCQGYDLLKNLFGKWFQMLITLVETRSMNQSQPKKQAPFFKDVSKCQRALLTRGHKTNWSQRNVMKWSQRQTTASIKIKNKKCEQNSRENMQ